ncbi:MAG: chromosomal replication initiator protein DnaA [Chlorobi bacterium OLB5]|nr:MAG: chromosomal replication initiator protein DnaA [Chlorobi bacterium OLB5]
MTSQQEQIYNTEDNISSGSISQENKIADTSAQDAFNTWTRFMDIVKLNVSDLKLNTWFKPIKPKSLTGSTLTISVPSQDYYEMIISRFGDIVTRAIRSILGNEGKIVYEIDPRTTFSQEPELIDTPPPVSSVQQTAAFNPDFYRPGITAVQVTPEGSPEFTQKCFLNPDYTFENFVKGKNNEFATAAAISIANKPGAQYNPLMLYGGVGLGKTHLMQAIGNHVKGINPAMKVMYVSGPEFTTNFVQSIRTNRAHEFERYYKSLDLLIVDDIQFLEGKESTQDSFFQIFNSLYQLKKQIVLSCDKPPHQLEGLEERLITRFQWGLTVDIQAPDLETRIAILNKKCEKEGFNVPYEVLEFIALNIKDNIRSLEGCLKSLLFDAELSKMPINIDMAKRSVIKFGGIKNRKQNIDISTIIAAVAKYFNIDESLLRLKSKQQEIVHARHTAMYLSKELTSSSLQTIGAHFGGRNHATVIHACKCIEEVINTDHSFKDKLEQIKEMLLT